jgi:hypothetical protein
MAGAISTTRFRFDVILRFPPRRISAIIICKERDGGWLTLAGAHGWAFGSLAEARLEARWLARNLQLPIREFPP